MKIFISIISIALPFIAFASGSEHGSHGGGHEGIPTVVWWQFANVLILFGGMYYFLKDGIVSFFAQRKETFEHQAKKSQEIKVQAEAQYAEIKDRLDQLSLGADESIARAKAEAADLKKQLIADAESIAKRLKEDAQQMAAVEAEKAKQSLRDQLIVEAFNAAEAALNKDTSAGDHKNLQSGFINQVGAVK